MNGLADCSQSLDCRIERQNLASLELQLAAISVAALEQASGVVAAMVELLEEEEEVVVVVVDDKSMSPTFVPIIKLLSSLARRILTLT